LGRPYFPGEAAVEQDELNERRCPGGKGKRGHRVGRIGLDTGHVYDRHDRNQHERAQYERRKQRDIDGVVRARQPVKRAAHRI
jgi:hypothetical protein